MHKGQTVRDGRIEFDKRHLLDVTLGQVTRSSVKLEGSGAHIAPSVSSEDTGFLGYGCDSQTSNVASVGSANQTYLCLRERSTRIALGSSAHALRFPIFSPWRSLGTLR